MMMVVMMTTLMTMMMVIMIDLDLDAGSQKDTFFKKILRSSLVRVA